MSKAKDLKTRFETEILPKLKEEMGTNNTMAIPKLKKVTINVGIGSHVKKAKKEYDHIVENITKIAGQKPMLTKSKKAISNFKLREGEVIGIAVTLRGDRMYDFVEKLINIVFPRVRDFRGISQKSFDGQGNYSIGFKEHIVFPEISPDDVINIHGLQVNIETTANTNEDGLKLLTAMGFPFKKVTK